MNPNTPCVIGVAQRTIRPDEGPAPEPLQLWADICRAAAGDTGVAADRVLAAADSLAVLYCQSWPYDDPAGRLAAQLGIEPADRYYSGIGGTTPHLLLQRAAAAITAGDADVAVVVGGEALETVRQAKKAGERLPWSHRDPERKPFPFEAPFHPAEVAHQVFQAWLTFALFDVGRRADRDEAPAEYRQALGELFAPMTKVAATNPHAWFRDVHTPAELIEPTPANRMVGYPYTKTIISIMDVDMAAALVVASAEAADDLGVSPERRVFFRGAGQEKDPVYVASHPDLGASPAMAIAASTALRAAGIGIDEVTYLDLYSCFGSSVNLACDALGLKTDDQRGFTVTGGLPFAGGPGSGYMLHSAATMVDRLRADPGTFGLASGVGMHMTKHAFGIYSTTPPPAPLGPPPPATVPHEKSITDTYSGSATVATYTVVHDRSGAPEWGVAVCDLPDGSRTYGRFEEPDLLAHAEETEWVGSPVRLQSTPEGVNRVHP